VFTYFLLKITYSTLTIGHLNLLSQCGQPGESLHCADISADKVHIIGFFICIFNLLGLICLFMDFYRFLIVAIFIAS